jgi:hypothetical protein
MRKAKYAVEIGKEPAHACQIEIGLSHMQEKEDQGS